MMTKDFDRLLTVSDAAEFLRLSESWLNKGRITGDGPRFVKMGRSVRYSLQALEEFKRANARGSTSEYERHAGPGRPAKENALTLRPRSSPTPAPAQIPQPFTRDASACSDGAPGGPGNSD